MKKLSWSFLILIAFFVGRYSSSPVIADVTTENTGRLKSTLEATFVTYQNSHVASTLTSDSGKWYIDENGAPHVPYLVLEPRSESDLPTPLVPGMFYIMKDPIRVTAVDAGGTLRTSQMICETDIYLYNDLIVDEVFYWDGKKYYGDSLY